MKRRTAILALAMAVGSTPPASAVETSDPLLAEVERWEKFVAATQSPDEIWGQAKGAAVPELERARQAIADGRRWFALQRLGHARGYLASWQWVLSVPPEARKEPAAFEREWQRAGEELRAELQPPRPADFAGLEPVILRALAESSWPQIKVYYDASPEYGRNTDNDSGLIYIGLARAQRDFVAMLRSLSAPSGKRMADVPPLGPRIDGLQRDLLAGYRPPASIDRHPEFILTSSLLKEARELEAARLHYGAFFKYLQAGQRFDMLRRAATPAPSWEAEALAPRVREAEQALGRGELDDSLERFFVEGAAADVAAAPGSNARPLRAVSALEDVLPRYRAAMSPASTPAPPVAPAVTVTLVRWPYT
jgi:hypothetical protein